MCAQIQRASVPIYFSSFFMKTTTTLSIAAALTLAMGSIPAAIVFADSSDMSGTNTMTPIYRMQGSSSSSSDYWNSWNMQGNSSSMMNTQGMGCTGMTGTPLDQCLQNLGVSQDTSNPWTSMTSNSWAGSMPSFRCDSYTGTDHTNCQQQLLLDWQSSYRAFQNWETNTSNTMQQMMQTSGLTTLQIQGILNGSITTQSANGGYSDVSTMRDAWKICQQFTGRTQARCMRDALTGETTVTGINSFSQWEKLANTLNNGTYKNTSSSSWNSSSSMSSAMSAQ
jgi:hypothetical protein